MALPVDRIHDFPSVQRALEFLSGRFPLKGQDISDGAVTDAKLATVTIRGGVTSTGGVAFGSGFTVARTPAGNSFGDYTVTFTTTFSAQPSIQVSMVTLGSVAVIRIGSQSASSFRVLTSNGSFSTVDCPFNFTAEAA